MNGTIEERQAVWDQFLQRWPLETLSKMTLDQYAQAGDNDSFVNWLETGTVSLGSIWGGSSFKFGVYSRKDQTPKSNGKGLRYTQDYAWLGKYGDSPETAFEKVRAIIIQVAKAARVGDLATVEVADLGTVTKWKIAFLYQDQQKPCVLPIFKMESLQAIAIPDKRKSCIAMHSQFMAERQGQSLLTYGDQLWARIQAIDAAKLSTEDAQAFLMGHEDLSLIKTATERMAGFRTTGGRELALALDNKTPTLYLSQGGWLTDVVQKSLEAVTSYPTDKSRSSNLAANAPTLAEGNAIVKVTVPTRQALAQLCAAYAEEESDNAPITKSVTDGTTMTRPPLNQILFGPPGTGKTYATINAALEILDPDFLAEHGADRATLKARFDMLTRDRRVQFVTFHQSFSYEDFVEGLRADSDVTTGQLRYPIVDGVFKTLCEAAAVRVTQQTDTSLDISGRRIWKMSLGNTLGNEADIYEECIAGGFALLGYGGAIDFAGCKNRVEVLERFEAAGAKPDKPQNDYGVTSVSAFVTRMKVGDILVISDGNFKFRAIGEVSGDYAFRQHPGYEEDYSQSRPVKWLRQYQPSLPYIELMNNQFSQMTLYELKPGSVDMAKLQALLNQGLLQAATGLALSVGQRVGSGYEVVRATADLVELKKPKGNRLAFAMNLLETLAKGVREGRITTTDIRDKLAIDKLADPSLEPYLVNGYNNILAPLVDQMLDMNRSHSDAAQRSSAMDGSAARVLIIDEINRGNISRIFGELITLIEPSKRAGADEALQAVLPYSKSLFSVPGNVYLIGTMNTADRSLAGLDVALRRRFVFKEMLPRPDLLDDVVVGNVNIGQLLAVMNQRIEALLDREHCIGHAYFMPLEKEVSIEKLAEIFKNQVLPLLQEYFFDDWQRIQWVLNDHRKPDRAHRFILGDQLNTTELFGNNVNVSHRSQTWKINSGAFFLEHSYLGLLNTTDAA